VTAPVELGMHLADPIDAVVVGVHPAEHLQPLLVGNRPRRGHPGLGGVVAARGDRHPGLAQDGADRLDPELLAVLIEVKTNRRSHLGGPQK
jgi:hypothetical protein